MNKITQRSASQNEGRWSQLRSALRRLLLLNATVAGLALSMSFLVTSAQALEEGASDDDQVPELIVVTTRRMEENVQDVLNYDDFVTAVNGLVTLRGLVQADIQNRVTNVAVFTDGLHIPRNYSIDLGVDFERVEVV